MKKSLLLSALFIVSLNYCSAQYKVQIVQEDSLHRVQLTEYAEDYDKVTTFARMEVKDARSMRDSLKVIYNSKDQKLEEDLSNCLQDIDFLQAQLKEAKSAKNKIEKRIKRRDDRKASKQNF